MSIPPEEGTIDIRFDGPPGPKAGRFVEVERDGASVAIGEWIEDGQYWVLRIPDPEYYRIRLEAALRDVARMGGP